MTSGAWPGTRPLFTRPSAYQPPGRSPSLKPPLNAATTCPCASGAIMPPHAHGPPPSPVPGTNTGRSSDGSSHATSTPPTLPRYTTGRPSTYRPAGAHATEPPGLGDVDGGAICVRTAARSSAPAVTGTTSAAAMAAPTSPPQSRRTKGDSGRSRRPRTVGADAGAGLASLGESEMPFCDVVAI